MVTSASDWCRPSRAGRRQDQRSACCSPRRRCCCRANGRGTEAAAGAPTAQGVGGCRIALPPSTLGPYPRRPVLALESMRAIAAAVHRGPAPPAGPVDLDQPRNRLLGAAQTLRDAIGDHALADGAFRPGVGSSVWPKPSSDRPARRRSSNPYLRAMRPIAAPPFITRVASRNVICVPWKAHLCSQRCRK